MTTLPAGLPTQNEEEQIDNEFMHIYQTMHSLFHIELDVPSQYSLEELSIEGV